MVQTNGTQLHLSIASAIPSAAPVKVETPDVLLLGDAYRCEPHGSACRVSVNVRYQLLGLAELAQLNRTLIELGAPPGKPVRSPSR